VSLSTHVLDARTGTPAVAVGVHLAARLGSAEGGRAWHEIAHARTDSDGRVRELATGDELSPGHYKITFDTGAYFAKSGVDTFYPEVTVVFEITDPMQHHHVPLLLSPFAYSTYRGS
jgi:5-hydroxyisourate hydrolase